MPLTATLNVLKSVFNWKWWNKPYLLSGEWARVLPHTCPSCITSILSHVQVTRIIVTCSCFVTSAGNVWMLFGCGAGRDKLTTNYQSFVWLTVYWLVWGLTLTKHERTQEKYKKYLLKFNTIWRMTCRCSTLYKNCNKLWWKLCSIHKSY